MKCELKLTDQVVLGKSLKIVEVINIIHDNLEDLFFFELVSNIETLDPIRIEIIHNDLSHSDLGPHIASLFEKYTHSICSCERVKIWKIPASESQS